MHSYNHGNDLDHRERDTSSPRRGWGRNTRVYFFCCFPPRTLDLQIYRGTVFTSFSSSPSDQETVPGAALAMAQVHRSQMVVFSASPELTSLLNVPGSQGLQPSHCARPFHQSSLFSAVGPPPHPLNINSAPSSPAEPLTFPSKLALSPVPLLCPRFTLVIITG